MKILVTGGCGYTGTILVNDLLNENHKVIVIDTQWFGNYLKKNKNLKIIKEDIRNLVAGTIYEATNENTIMEKDDRCTRLAKSKYDTWPSAYASGAVVRCRRGDIWKKK